MHPNHQLITRFYTAFQQGDHKTMGACYHPQATFRDTVFDLKTVDEIRAMWEMLCRQSKDFSLSFNAVKADDVAGSAHWEAHYTFSKTGRHVHNIIDADFNFRDGLIVSHRDHFGFWRWSRQALGLPGLLLGFTPLLQRRVQATARQSLDTFMQRQKQS
jgi:ketosteroid isomerase-like protein